VRAACWPCMHVVLIKTMAKHFDALLTTGTPAGEQLLYAGPKPVRGTLCAGDYAVERKSPEAMQRSPSRFPYEDR
jgi:hypothetical protein